MRGDYSELMRQVARLLGHDPWVADRNGVARYRSRGSLKIDFAHGTFFDFEAGVGGGLCALIRHATGEDARNWFERQGFAFSSPSAARACALGRDRTQDCGWSFIL